jgi:phosphate transport system substrate-binding protein
MLRTTKAVLLGGLFGVVWLASALAGERLVIKGSNTYGELLGKKLAAEFQRLHPGVEFDQESKGTATGYAALLSGECDLAAASRPATEDELRLARSRGIQIRMHTVGYYGIAVVVHAGNPIRSLTDRQVREIFTGATKRWSQLGGPDQPIRVYVADPSLGTYLGFQELALGKAAYSPAATALPGYAEIAAGVRGDAQGIGYVTFALAGQEGVRAVLINGVAANDLAVNHRLYPYARQVWLASNPRRESAVARRFLRFVQSRPGQQAVEAAGFIRALTGWGGVNGW